MLKLYDYECAEGHVREVMDDSDTLDWIECDECGCMLFKKDGIPGEGGPGDV